MRIRMEDSNGDSMFGYGSADIFANSPEAVALLVENRLQLVLGEWYLDKTAGVDWASVRGYGPNRIRDLVIQEAISTTQGVTEITAYASALNPETREFAVAATIATEYGAAQISVTA